MRDHASGFCVYNDAAVAISWLLDHGFERIAYVDVDVHHGDGVQAAFYDDPRVLTIRCTSTPLTLFPGTGCRRRSGPARPKGTPSTCTAARHRDAGWLRAFHAVVPVACGRSGRSCSSASAVPTRTSKTRWPTCGSSVDGHRAIYRELRELAEEVGDGHWLALGGGGYGLFRVGARGRGRTCSPTVLDRDLDRTGRYRTVGVRRVPAHRATCRPGSDGRGRRPHEPWTEGADQVDAAVLDTRRAVSRSTGSTRRPRD